MARDGTYTIAADRAPDRLDRALRNLLSGASWNEVRKLIASGKVSVNGRVVTDDAHSVGAGDELAIRMTAPKPRTGPALPNGAIVHLDAQVVVVDKPAGISSVPFDASETGTLDELVRAELDRRERRRTAELGVVHRLDKETSGILVFARTLAAKRALKQQFRFHTTARRYLALVQGDAPAQTLHCRLVRDRGDGRRGSTENPKLGRPSTTHVRPVERLRGATLIECRLETGRTHQIRIQLSEAGHPVLGDRIYGSARSDASVRAPRTMLHAAELGFTHPTSGQRLLFESEPPEDFRALLAELRRR